MHATSEHGGGFHTDATLKAAIVTQSTAEISSIVVQSWAGRAHLWSGFQDEARIRDM